MGTEKCQNPIPIPIPIPELELHIIDRHLEAVGPISGWNLLTVPIWHAWLTFRGSRPYFWLEGYSVSLLGMHGCHLEAVGPISSWNLLSVPIGHAWLTFTGLVPLMDNGD